MTIGKHSAIQKKKAIKNISNSKTIKCILFIYSVNYVYLRL